MEEILDFVDERLAPSIWQYGDHLRKAEISKLLGNQKKTGHTLLIVHSFTFIVLAHLHVIDSCTPTPLPVLFVRRVDHTRGHRLQWNHHHRDLKKLGELTYNFA